MNTTKKIHVNFSSLLGLKAELLRKQTEVNIAKLRTEPVHAVPKLKRKPNKPDEESINEKLNEVTDVDSIKTHKKSKLMLEAKAKLYERLKKSKNNNENFLVDFESKLDDSGDESLIEKEDNDTMFQDEDEDGWIEYKDCFGRTRKCLREDLPLMQQKDDLIKQQVMNRNIENTNDRDAVEKHSIAVEKEPEIEIMRRKWEEQMQKLADKANIHYQDILFDEARAHGVGYYAFSQDEEERTKQQENLIKLRKDTEDKQKEMKEVRELKERMEQNRLKAARIRKRIRAGLPAEPTIEELSQESRDAPSSNMPESTCDTNNVEDNLGAENDKKEDRGREDCEENAATIKGNKVKALEEVLGKRTWYEMSQEEWVDKRRKDRVNEFGPVYSNFTSAGYLHSEHSENEDLCSNNRMETRSKMKCGMESNTNSVMRPSCVPLKTNVNDRCKENENANENAKDNTIGENSPRFALDKSPLKSSDSIEKTVPNQSFQSSCSTLPSIENERVRDVPHFSDSIHDTQSSKNTIENYTTTNRAINEESITAGLRYLREKFEKRQNT